MKVMFLDESGDHNLSIIDPQYPLFVLGGVIIDLEYAEISLEETLNDFKKEVFGRTDLVLHTADIARNKNGFERLKEPGFRTFFYERLNAMMRGLDFTVVACAIRKNAHLAKYGLGALDPYMLSLDILVERFCLDLGNHTNSGHDRR
jgi:Protein of unknown function (DUF3800)